MKILEYKLNAIMAKARAIYGRRLTLKDYESLINCSSVSEITAYLRASTSYAQSLEKIASSDISAGHLEFLIKKSEYEAFDKLYRYEVAFGQELYNYFVKDGEIELILSKIRAIILGNSVEAAASMPQLYVGSPDIDLAALAKAATFEELISSLSGTPYKAIIEKCRTNGDRDYIDYECAFMNYFHEFEYELIRKTYGKHNALIGLLSYKADTEFIDKLYRTKKYFPASAQKILHIITPVHLTNFTPKQIGLLINAKDENEVLDVLSSTQYKEIAKEIKNSDYAEQAIARLNYKKYKHLLRFSQDPNEIMFCFMFLIGNEITNLIHIIEGVKYKMDTESIKQLLIGVGD